MRALPKKLNRWISGCYRNLLQEHASLEDRIAVLHLLMEEMERVFRYQEMYLQDLEKNLSSMEDPPSAPDTKEWFLQRGKRLMLQEQIELEKKRIKEQQEDLLLLSSFLGELQQELRRRSHLVVLPAMSA